MDSGPLTPSRRWTVITVLCLIYVFAYCDRVTMSVALTTADFKAFFRLRDVDRGQLSAAFFWTYAALQIPAGWVVDRVGARRSIAVGFLIWSVVAASTGAVQTYGSLFLLRLVLGVGEAVITPGGMRWIRYNVAEERRGLVIGIFMAAAKVGPAIGNVAATALLAAYGWRPMFVILGLGGLVCLLPWVALAGDRDLRGDPSVRRGPSPAARVPWRSPVLWGTLVATFSYQYFNYFCMTWMQAYLVDRFHMSSVSMGLFAGASYGGFALVAIAAGAVADHLIRGGRDPVKVRRAFAVGGLLLGATELIGGLSDSPSVALFFAVFSLSGLGLTTANYWALTQTLLPGAAVGALVGVQNCAANVPGIVAPILTGWLKQATGSYRAPMAAVAVFLLLGVASYALLVRRRYAPRF